MTPKISVCLVDDDDSNLAVMRLILLGMGIVNIVSFADARQAWSHIRDASPSIVVSDWNMDPMNGLELLALVRGYRSTSDIPFIMVTANISEDYWRRAIEAGASDFLFKPFRLDAFRSAIEIALGLRLNSVEQLAIPGIGPCARTQTVRAC